MAFAAHGVGSVFCSMCYLQHVGLVPLGSMLQEVYYLQHFGLVPAWFHLVPAARSMVFIAHGVGSVSCCMCYLRHVGLVPLGSMLQEELLGVRFLQHMGVVLCFAACVI